MGDFQFGFDIHLVFNVCPVFVLLRLSVLTDQDKAGKENCFQGDNHGQETKWKWIKCLVTHNNGIERDPDDKPESVRNKKWHAATEPGEPIGDPLQDGRVQIGRASCRE